MADTKISGLASGGKVQTTDEIPVNRGGLNAKVTVGALAAKDTASAVTDVTGLAAVATSGAKADVGLGAVTNDPQTKAAIVPNTAPGAGQLLVGNAGGTAYAPVTATGDVTNDSSGVMTIGNNKVTYAKMQDVSAASKLLGRGDSGAGDPEEISIGSGLSITGTTLSATATGGGVTIGQSLAMAAGLAVQ